MNLLETLSYLNSKRIKYYDYFIHKTSNQITMNEVFGDLFDMDKRLNNGKAVKSVQRKISKILSNLF